MKNHHSILESLEPYKWLLKKHQQSDSSSTTLNAPYYGDLTELNTHRVILDSVGEEALKEIAEDSINLLETFVAIYELNGDYAFSMSTSGWCRMMDAASRRLCKTNDNREALGCGYWLCHENCWNDSAKAAMESGQSTDIQCIGGINLCSEPIYAGGQVIGAIAIGYGTPPTDSNYLKELSEKFNIGLNKLEEQARCYDSRPQFLINLAKKRLKTSARFVGELVEKSIFQAELKRKKRLLDDTNRMAKVGGWELDANSLELTWTDETYRIHEFTLDYTPTLEEAINFFHPDDTSKLKSAVQRALAHGEPYDMELRFITAKGKNLWTHSICHPEIVNGKTVKLKGTFQDITEQKKAEEKLKESQERYYRLVEISPDMIAIHLDAIIFYINNAGANMLGFSNPEQIIGKSFLEFLPSSEKEIAKSRMKKLLRSNRRSPLYNHTLIRPNGTKIFVEVVGIPINYKGETTIQINARDVTKRKKTEAILQKTNERLKEKSVALEDMNATLRTLLNKKDQDVKEIEEKIFCNYDSIIMPFFDKLKNSYSNKVQRSLIETIETNLKEIISPFSKKLSDPMINFTPKEIQVASFIKQGITSKEIAQILDCSVRTIDTHRDNIRVKLKIKNKKINLRSYLMILL